MTSLRADIGMEEKYEVFYCPVLRNGTALGLRTVAQTCVIDCK